MFPERADHGHVTVRRFLTRGFLLSLPFVVKVFVCNTFLSGKRIAQRERKVSPSQEKNIKVSSQIPTERRK